jgi:RNA polymerase sigma-70 factor (ECF subfamily)
MIADIGCKARLWGDGLFGGEAAIRLLFASMPDVARIGASIEPREINGQPGAIFRDRDGLVVNTWSLDIADGRI